MSVLHAKMMFLVFEN